MNKQLKQIIFRPVEGVWQDVTGDSGTFADFLTEYEIYFDDRSEFVRLKDYKRNIAIWIRAEAAKICVTIWRISQN